MNQNNQQPNMYPNLSQFFADNMANTGNQEQAAQAPMMQLLEALGLLPPGTAQHPAPTAPPAASAAPQATASAPPAAENAPQGNSNAAPSAPYEENQSSNANQGQQQQQNNGQSSSNQQGCSRCNQQPEQQNWWNYHNNSSWCSSNNRRQNYPTCNNFDLPAFLVKFGRTVKNIVHCSTKVSCLFFMLILIHILTPAAILQNIVFMVLAAGMGLHMPTLLAGQMLWAGVGCLRLFEPFLLVGILVFSLHKMMVRREPLFDHQFWRNRFGSLRVEINDNFN